MVDEEIDVGLDAHTSLETYCRKIQVGTETPINGSYRKITSRCPLHVETRLDNELGQDVCLYTVAVMRF